MAFSSMDRVALIVDEDFSLKRDLSQHARVTERVAAGLRVDAEAVRSLADRNTRKETTVGCIERVNLGIVPAG
jgi:hypothetical protein